MLKSALTDLALEVGENGLMLTVQDSLMKKIDAPSPTWSIEVGSDKSMTISQDHNGWHVPDRRQLPTWH